MSKKFKILDVALDGLPPATSGRGRARRYPWPDMEVGQSIFVPFTEKCDTPSKLTKRLRNNVAWAKKNGQLDASAVFNFALYPADGAKGVLAGRVE